MNRRNDAARYAIANALLDDYTVQISTFKTDGDETVELLESHHWSRETVWKMDVIEEFEALCSRYDAEVERMQYYDTSLTVVLYA